MLGGGGAPAGSEEEELEDREVEEIIYRGLFCKIGRHKLFVFATWT
jgi:hypothetical protein